MTRSGTLVRTLLVTMVVVTVVGLQVQVALSSGMSPILSLNARDAKADDAETHLWSLREAVRWNPHEYHALYRLGSHYFDSGDEQAARTTFEACLEDAPGHLGALLGMAELNARTGNADEARSLIERARTVAPTSWRVYLAAGALETRLGNHPEAIRLLEKAERLARSPVTVILNALALAHLMNRDAESALTYAERSLDVKRNNPDTLLVKGKALAVLDRPDESVEAFRAAAEGFDDKPLQRSDARLHLAGALAETGEVLEASTIVRDEVRASPQVPQVLATAEPILRLLDQLINESEVSAEAVGQVQCNLAYTYAAMGRLKEAERHFGAAVASESELDASCVWAHAETLLRMERWEEAVARYEQALGMGPAPTQLRLGYAKALAQAGEENRARMQYVLLLSGYKLSDQERQHVQNLMDALP